MLRSENLSKTCGNGEALKGVSLDLPRGMFGLLEPHEAGRSTLIRTIASVQGVDSGSIFLDDVDVLNEKNEVRKTQGTLPQEMGITARLLPLLQPGMPRMADRGFVSY